MHSHHTATSKRSDTYFKVFEKELRWESHVSVDSRRQDRVWFLLAGVFGKAAHKSRPLPAAASGRHLWAYGANLSCIIGHIPVNGATASSSATTWLRSTAIHSEMTHWSRFDAIIEPDLSTGKRPFACEVCGKGFSTPSGRSRHRICVHRRETKNRTPQPPTLDRFLGVAGASNYHSLPQSMMQSNV